MQQYENVFVMDHPLIQHKLTFLRDVSTGTKNFRELVSEIATLMCYEATRDLPLMDVETVTPMEKTVTQVIAGRKLAFVPILRARLLPCWRQWRCQYPWSKSARHSPPAQQQQNVRLVRR